MCKWFSTWSFDLKNMLSSNDEGEEIFFDSVDYIPTCDSVSSEESGSGSGSGELDYAIWRNKPGSVWERRARFLRGMGFNEFSEGINDVGASSSVSSPNSLGLERITECTGAVLSSWGLFSKRREEGSVCSRRDMDSRVTFVAHEPGPHGSDGHATANDFGMAEVMVQREEHDGDLDSTKKKIRGWWNIFVQKTIKERRMYNFSAKNNKTPKTNRIKVRHNGKRCMELTAVYMGQEIHAHKGFIWTMKFSPDGQYLASGGEDGVVRIWHVTSTDASCKYSTAADTSKFVDKKKESEFILRKKNSNSAPVIIPEKVFKIEESPLQEFHGHTSGVLDLCWSKSNCLLSSSKDKTVRLWQVGFDRCCQVFYHNDYVTCIQFNPVDDGYFISGSIDGKVRIWGVSESRVVDWADIRDIVTAICYQPNGQGFVVGSVTGHCRFYHASGNNLQLDAQICFQSRRKSSGNRITGLQFSLQDSQRVMITSADSKVRVLDGVDVIHKYRGLRKSESQSSASFTSNGRHIISVGDDSRVYVWNYDDLCVISSKQAKSIRSCEHFFFEGVSVAIPWLGMEPESMLMKLSTDSLQCLHGTPENFASLPRDSECFSLGGWFLADGSLRGSATWPEEKLPLWAVPVAEHEHHHHNQPQQEYHRYNNHRALSATWGLVIVTAGWDGVIRTFHNFGLPIRL